MLPSSPSPHRHYHLPGKGIMLISQSTLPLTPGLSLMLTLSIFLLYSMPHPLPFVYHRRRRHMPSLSFRHRITPINFLLYALSCHHGFSVVKFRTFSSVHVPIDGSHHHRLNWVEQSSLAAHSFFDPDKSSMNNACW